MLNDISQLPSWSKVNKGMQRLYEGTVRTVVVIAITILVPGKDSAAARCD